MQLFFHDVGLKNADQDFPKTVFGHVPIATVEAHAPAELKAAMSTSLYDLFPEGACNAWGVPEGAKSVIKHLRLGDSMLLIRTTGGDGKIPALCIARAYWSQPMFELSEALWGSTYFPYIFFFETERIYLTWTQLKEDIGYAPNFRPSGHVYRIRQDRFGNFGSAKGYVSHLLAGTYLDIQTHTGDLPIPPMPTVEAEYLEGKRLTSERDYFRRNAQLVRQAKEKYGYTCQVCGFDFEKKYGALGSQYIECHHLNPLSERDDVEQLQATSIEEVSMLCSNCHRMIHRRRPALTVDELRHLIKW